MREFAEVEAEHLFVEVAERMKPFDTNVSTLQSAFEQTSEVFEFIGVHATVNVSLGWSMTSYWNPLSLKP